MILLLFTFCLFVSEETPRAFEEKYSVSNLFCSDVHVGDIDVVHYTCAVRQFLFNIVYHVCVVLHVHVSASTLTYIFMCVCHMEIPHKFRVTAISQEV